MAKQNKTKTVDTEVVPAENALVLAQKRDEEKRDEGMKAIQQLFAPREDLLAKISKMKRLNLPPMYKPDQIPVGGILSGEIVKFVDSPVTTIKGKLIWLKLANGQEITFPLTGVIRQTIAPAKEDSAEYDKLLKDCIGKMLICVRRENKISSTYKKEMYMWDIFLE